LRGDGQEEEDHEAVQALVEHLLRLRNIVDTAAARAQREKDRAREAERRREGENARPWPTLAATVDDMLAITAAAHEDMPTFTYSWTKQDAPAVPQTVDELSAADTQEERRTSAEKEAVAAAEATAFTSSSSRKGGTKGRKGAKGRGGRGCGGSGGDGGGTGGGGGGGVGGRGDVGGGGVVVGCGRRRSSSNSSNRGGGGSDERAAAEALSVAAAASLRPPLKSLLSSSSSKLDHLDAHLTFPAVKQSDVVKLLTSYVDKAAIRYALRFYDDRTIAYCLMHHADPGGQYWTLDGLDLDQKKKCMLPPFGWSCKVSVGG
jgi:hypothetical protein